MIEPIDVKYSDDEMLFDRFKRLELSFANQLLTFK